MARTGSCTMVLGLLLLCTACRKEDDKQPPQVQIVLPTQGSTFNVFDTLGVNAYVSDDHIVENVTIVIQNANGVPVVPSRSISIGTSNYFVQQALPIDNIHLATGSYTLSVRASDGNNDGRAFVSVNILEFPRVLNALVACIQDGPQVRVLRIDSMLQISEIAVHDMDLSVASVNSYHQQVQIGGGLNGDLLSVNASSGAIDWSVANENNSSLAYFTGLAKSVEGSNTFVSDSDGRLRGYAGNGAVVFAGGSISGYRPKGLLLTDDLLISEQKAIAGNDRQLVSYYLGSGVQAGTLTLDMSLVEAFERNAPTLLLFGSRNGEGVVQQANVDIGGTSDLLVLPQGPIIDAVKVDADTYVVSLPNELVRYTYFNNAAVTIHNGQTFSNLSYDVVSGAVYATVGSEIFWIDPFQGNTSSVITLNGDIAAFGLLHNK